MSQYKTFAYENKDGVGVVRFSNPPINLVDRSMIVDLLRLAQKLEGDNQTRVVIFRSENPDFFLAHYDLASQLDAPPMELPPGMPSPLSALFTRFSRLPQVTIGELSGRARGAGSEFLLALDMRFAARETALLGQPEIGVGLLPGAGGTVRLAQMLGRGRTLEVCLGGDDFDASTAELYGWINRALPGEKLSNFCDSLAHRIAGFPANGISNVKAIVNRISTPDDAVLADESRRFVSDMHQQETGDRVKWMISQGGQTPGALELELGRLMDRYPSSIDA